MSSTSKRESLSVFNWGGNVPQDATLWGSLTQGLGGVAQAFSEMQRRKQQQDQQALQNLQQQLQMFPNATPEQKQQWIGAYQQQVGKNKMFDRNAFQFPQQAATPGTPPVPPAPAGPATRGLGPMPMQPQMAGMQQSAMAAGGRPATPGTPGTPGGYMVPPTPYGQRPVSQVYPSLAPQLRAKYGTDADSVPAEQFLQVHGNDPDFQNLLAEAQYGGKSVYDVLTGGQPGVPSAPSAPSVPPIGPATTGAPSPAQPIQPGTSPSAPTGPLGLSQEEIQILRNLPAGTFKTRADMWTFVQNMRDKGLQAALTATRIEEAGAQTGHLRAVTKGLGTKEQQEMVARTQALLRQKAEQYLRDPKSINGQELARQMVEAGMSPPAELSEAKNRVGQQLTKQPVGYKVGGTTVYLTPSEFVSAFQGDQRLALQNQTVAQGWAHVQQGQARLGMESAGLELRRAEMAIKMAGVVVIDGKPFQSLSSVALAAATGQIDLRKASPLLQQAVSHQLIGNNPMLGKAMSLQVQMSRESGEVQQAQSQLAVAQKSGDQIQIAQAQNAVTAAQRKLAGTKAALDQSIQQMEQGGLSQPPPSGPQFATEDEVAEYAKQMNISVAAAREQFEGKGIKVVKQRLVPGK